MIPDEEKEVSVCGCAALSLASQAMCETAAALTTTPLYQHIAKIKFEEVVLVDLIYVCKINKLIFFAVLRCQKHFVCHCQCRPSFAAASTCLESSTMCTSTC